MVALQTWRCPTGVPQARQPCHVPAKTGGPCAAPSPSQAAASARYAPRLPPTGCRQDRHQLVCAACAPLSACAEPNSALVLRSATPSCPCQLTPPAGGLPRAPTVQGSRLVGPRDALPQPGSPHTRACSSASGCKLRSLAALLAGKPGRCAAASVRMPYTRDGAMSARCAQVARLHRRRKAPKLVVRSDARTRSGEATGAEVAI